DPDGRPVVREIIPDDGITEPAFADRIAGWADELQYYANLRAKGTHPTFRWSAWSDPQRLQAFAARTFQREIEGGQPGTYRIVLAGTPDNYVTLNISNEL